MRDDYFWALFGGGFIFFWALLITFTQQLRAARRLRLRELEHKERLLALEKGLPLPEEPPAGFSPAGLLSLALAAGLLLVFLGGGVALALYLGAESRSESTRWSYGLIPVMAGVGLLLYSWIGRRFPVA